MLRREFLTSGAAVTLAAGSGLTLTLRRASAAGHGVSLAAAQRFRFGEVTVTALSDGYLQISPDVLLGIDAAGFEELSRAAFLDPARALQGSVNAYAIQRGDDTVLVDSGTGSIFGPTLGQLHANLAAAGIDPASVSRLVVTHLHGDHIGGCFTEAGPAFPNAEMVLTEADHAFWSSDEMKSMAPEPFRPAFDLARAAVAAYGERVSLVATDADLGGRLSLRPFPGHTPGHAGVLVETGAEPLLIWADIVHVPHVQFARPEVSIAFDVDPAEAAATRAAAMGEVAEDRTMIAGMHLPFPGIGHAERAGDAFGYTPLVWQYL